MEFWASSEVSRLAYPAMNKVRKCVESFLNAEFAISKFSTLNAKFRYIPIIMPDTLQGRYPARSKLRKKEAIYLCAPQLDYEIFVSGTFEAQLREYLRGIAESAPYLAGLGATPEQISDFEHIMATALERILAEQSDQTRH